MPRARHAGGAQHRLHLRFLPEVLGRDHLHAGDAEVLADLGDGFLQLFQDGQQPLHRAEPLAERLHRAGDLPGVERVVYPPVPGQGVLEPGRQAVLGLARDQGQPHVRQLRRRLDESRRGAEQIGRDERGDHHEMNVPCRGSCGCAACRLAGAS